MLVLDARCWDVAFEEAREHLPDILQSRKIPVASAIAALELVSRLVQMVEAETYSSFETISRERVDRRDEDDWPVLAAALAFDLAKPAERDVL